LTELGIGEALVGGLEEKGMPAMVQRVAIAPPQSRIGPLSDAERAALIAGSALRGHYDKPVDRISAYEILGARARQASEPQAQKPKQGRGRDDIDLGELAGRVVKSALSQAAGQLGRQLARGLLGSLLGGKR